MKAFNPEKELKKIQYKNKSKIILFVFLLLVVGVIGYSFALYQVRYSKRIIYTKVAPFSNRDIELAVKIEDEEGTRKTFPSKNEGFLYSGIECEINDLTTATWDETDWLLDIKTKGPNKCTVLFKKDKRLTTYIANLSEENLIIDETKDLNKRYIGADPDNYVWFNCDNYDLVKDNESAAQQNCEKWRIIGLMSNITKSDNNQENLVKIIRDESIGLMHWDNTNNNNWANATLQKGLNGPYLNNTDDSWVTDSYYGTENTRSENYKSITSETKAKMIEKVRWNIGGTSNWNNSITSQLYNAERSTTIPKGAQATLDEYIGLMYPSDYGYAASGGDDTYSRSWCLEHILYTWQTGSYGTYCASTSWIKPKTYWAWTITPYSSDTTHVFILASSGQCHSANNWGDGQIIYGYYDVYPTLYLKSSVEVVSGTGSSETPYILVP